MAAKTPRGGELPLDEGSTPYEPNDVPEPADAKVTVTATDDVTTDDLTLDALKLVPGLESLTSADKVSVGVLTDPTSKVRGLSPTVIGNTVVSFPDGEGKRAINVVCSVLNFPVSEESRGTPQVRVLKPKLATQYWYCFDDITGVIEEGKVPEENSQGRKRAQTSWVPEDRDWKANDAVFEISSGLYWIVTGGAVGGGSLSSVKFTAAAPLVLENLDDWDDEWAPDLDYTFDYTEQARKGRNSNGVLGKDEDDNPIDGFPIPADPSKVSSWDEELVKAAALQLFPRDATFKSGMPLTKLDEDSAAADWKAKFDEMYVTNPKALAADQTYHPSVVSALIQAGYASFDNRPDFYYQTADSAGQEQAQYGVTHWYFGYDLKQDDDSPLINPLAAADALVGVPKPVVPPKP